MAKHRLLILGANGKLGRMVTRALQAGVCPNVEAIGVARDHSADLHWAPGQGAQDLPAVDTIAALWGVIPGEGADLALNTKLAQQAQALGKALGARRVLHCSSIAVYGPTGSPFAETADLLGTSPYARAKIEMEQALAGQPGQVVLRIGSVVGAESLGASIARGKVTLDRFTDGSTPKRSYIAPGDVARAIATLALHADPPPVLNLGAPRPTEMDSLVRAAGVIPTYRAAPKGALADATLDPARMMQTLGDQIRADTPDKMIADWRRWAEVAA